LETAGLTAGLVGGLSNSQIITRTIPNEGIRRSLRNALISVLSGGLVGGLIGGLGVGVMAIDQRMLLTNTLLALFYGLGIGLGAGLGGGLVSRLVLGLVFGLFIMTLGFPFVQLVYLPSCVPPTCDQFNKQLGQLGALVVLGIGLFFGLIGGLAMGGSAYLKHYVLRFLLWRNDYAPLNYIRFLDYAAERVFLRKVGGGYIFTHRLLMEYFASLEPIEQGRQVKAE
jgi:hypothetical protein